MMPNGTGGKRRIFMMKTGEMKWNGGSQNTGNEENGGQIGKVFRVAPPPKDTRKWASKGGTHVQDTNEHEKTSGESQR